VWKKLQGKRRLSGTIRPGNDITGWSLAMHHKRLYPIHCWLLVQSASYSFDFLCLFVAKSHVMRSRMPEWLDPIPWLEQARNANGRAV
jgi:hypothetical protein